VSIVLTAAKKSQSAKKSETPSAGQTTNVSPAVPQQTVIMSNAANVWTKRRSTKKDMAIKAERKKNGLCEQCGAV
jgi:hypothetical protein